MSASTQASGPQAGGGSRPTSQRRNRGPRRPPQQQPREGSPAVAPNGTFEAPLGSPHTAGAGGPIRGPSAGRGRGGRASGRGGGQSNRNQQSNSGRGAGPPATPHPHQQQQQQPNLAPPTSLILDAGNDAPRVRFDSLLSSGLVSAETLRGVVHEYMSPVQAATMHDILLGNDCLAQAKTGTGKTLAFLVPSIELLRKNGFARGVNILIISPTRELAFQIGEQAKELVRFDQGQIGVQMIVGGTNMNQDKRKLRSEACHILVATPGRLLDHLQNGDLKPMCAGLKALILDEADRLLEQGFRQDIERILTYLPNKDLRPRQTLLFSATMPPGVKQIATLALNRNFKFISTISESDAATHTHVDQHVIEAPLSRSISTTFSLIAALHAAGKSKIIVFLPTARATQLYFETYSQMNSPNSSRLPCYELHSRKSQSVRTKTSERFRDATQAVLFSSDVSARGMDFPDVAAVVQTGLPQNAEQYVHRLGRTARAGKQGEGYLILMPNEKFFVRKLKGMELQELAAPHDVEATQQLVNHALAQVSPQTKQQTYAAWMGYYKGFLRDLGWTSRDLVAAANQMAFDFGCTAVPPMLAKTVGKMGLRGTPGLNVVQVLPSNYD
ncbi:hypothetical protein HDU86_005171 [Geranomyces michiganensis]|nr:hypothetical protein HDU86_005171 [Geranomyces michiganensis]